MTLAANRRNPVDLDESDLTTTIDGYQNWTHSTRAEYQLTPKATLLFSGQYFAQKQEGVSENEGVVFDRLGDIDNFSGSVGTGYQLGSRSKLMGKIYATRYHDESTVIDRGTSLTASSNITVQDLIKGEAQFDTTLGSKNQLTCWRGVNRLKTLNPNVSQVARRTLQPIHSFSRTNLDQ